MKVAYKALKILFISWAALAVTTSGITGMVLCIGADGHAAMEMAGLCNCRSDENAHGHVQEAAVEMPDGADDDCCGPCVDVSLSTDIMSQSVSEEIHSQDDSSHSETVFSNPFVKNIAGIKVDWGPPPDVIATSIRVSYALTALRTIVLRI